MAMFNDSSFISLQNGLDAMWLKQQVASHNLAKKVLENAKTGESGGFEAVVETDEETAARPDGNNVQVESEELELWKAYTQYSALTTRMSGKLSTLRYVINNTGK